MALNRLRRFVRYILHLMKKFRDETRTFRVALRQVV